MVWAFRLWIETSKTMYTDIYSDSDAFPMQKHSNLNTYVAKPPTSIQLFDNKLTTKTLRMAQACDLFTLMYFQCKNTDN